METTTTTTETTAQTGAIKPALFALGAIHATPGALEALAEAYGNDTRKAGEESAKLLHRHESGDGGTLCREDQIANERAIKRDLRVFSVYFLPDGVKIWVITEWDRSYTTILLPSEY